MAEFETVDVFAAEERGALTLNRPEKLNPLSPQTLREIAEAARWFDRHPLVKVVVVSGQGRSFSAGADLGAFDGNASGAEGSACEQRRSRATDGRRRRGDERDHDRTCPRSLHRRWSGARRRLRSACRGERRLLLDPRGRPRHPARVGRHPSSRSWYRAGTHQGAGDDLPAVHVSRGPRRRVPEPRVVAAGDLDQEVEDLVAQLLTKSSLTLRSTKRHVDAVTRQMVGLDRSWADADSLVPASATRVAGECQGVSRQSEEEVTTPIDDVLEDLVAEYDRLESILASLTDDAVAKSSRRAPGWTVTDVMIHLAQTEEGVVGTTSRAERAESPGPRRGHARRVGRSTGRCRA